MSHEFDLIASVRKHAKANEHVVVGIGDDAAVLRGSSSDTLVATDMLMEGVHFIVDQTTPELIGRKSLAVNLSDIAAMAGTPTSAFVSVALPRRYGSEFAEHLMQGVQTLADEYQVALAGGDTNIWAGPLVVNVTVIGTAGPWGAVLRSGAQPGDVILVSGPLGGSIAGRHFTFQPRLKLARHIAQKVPIHAMIDISDGLISDLGHILDESGVGADVELDLVPIHSDVEGTLSKSKRLQHALGDGEDFELLICMSDSDAKSLAADWPFDVALTRVGRITQDPGCWGVDGDGRRQKLTNSGWEHRW